MSSITNNTIEYGTLGIYSFWPLGSRVSLALLLISSRTLTDIVFWSPWDLNYLLSQNVEKSFICCPSQYLLALNTGVVSHLDIAPTTNCRVQHFLIFIILCNFGASLYLYTQSTDATLGQRICSSRFPPTNMSCVVQDFTVFIFWAGWNCTCQTAEAIAGSLLYLNAASSTATARHQSLL